MTELIYFDIHDRRNYEGTTRRRFSSIYWKFAASLGTARVIEKYGTGVILEQY